MTVPRRMTCRRDDDLPGEDVPPPGDQDAPRPEDDYPCPDDGPDGRYRDDDDADSWTAKMPASNWPDLPATIPPALTRPSARPPDGRPPAGLLDVSLPWETLTATSPAPGHLGRIGPVTATQARHLAADRRRRPRHRMADHHHHTGRARPGRHPHPPPPAPGGQPPPGPGKTRAAHSGRTDPAEKPGESTARDRAGRPGTGLVGRITLTTTEDTLTRPPAQATRPATGPPGPPGQILGLALRAATRATARARAAMAADTTTPAAARTPPPAPATGPRPGSRNTSPPGI